MKSNKFIVMIIAVMATTGIISFTNPDKTGKSIEKLSGSVVLQWNEIAFKAFDGPAYQHSLMAARINAMTHLAMHDAVNAIYPKYATYKFKERDAAADPIAAVATAAYAVLVHEIPAKRSFLDSAWQISLSLIKKTEAKTRGIALGKKAAQAILDDRADDGAAGNPLGEIPASAVPGVYQAVPPFNIVFAPHWENVKLFSLQSKSQFRPGPHPSLSSAEYAAGFNEVKEKGKLNSSVRQADQTAYAKFWYEFSEAGWNRVARTAIINKKLNLPDAARVLALVDMAMADAYTAGWDAKFYYNFWRPYTAIRNAESDNNPATAPEKNWEPAEPTPPVHDYPSTHSALGNAGATVLARLLGDNTSFTMTSFTAVPSGSTRTFTSFSQAANENADSRVMAGIHFRFSCEAGQELGNKIGNWTVDNYLKPLK
ncbi:vanadium-dependent haloperoxidase [Terrimonas alba]|uniref:vanadium-dependent haloperoxidase n=1 Tax=Terrimonas alba TaxID=3349636 RepID=UPI0035F33067